jgi:hypothetical protein
VRQLLLDASQLTQPNVNFRTTQNQESCPVKISHGGKASYAYALCESKLVQACVTSGDTLANGGQRQCSFKASAQCKEVCMAPRFCKQRRGVVHGTDLAGASLEKLVRQIKSEYPKSLTKAQRQRKTAALVRKLLHTFDKRKGDGNEAISFFEFLHLFHTKPWSIWLRHLLPQHIDQARVASLATGQSQNREVFDAMQKIFDVYDIDGALVKRPKFPQQQACCFRDCSPPKDIGGHQMRSSLWCFAQALSGGVRLA